MRKILDITGRRFGRLVALRLDSVKDKIGAVWLCQCDCGSTKSVMWNNLRSGATQSCGCLHKERVTKHGKWNSRLYTIYYGMLQRCHNTANGGYKDYGGRGITVCDEWRSSFQSFYDWAHNSGYRENLTIERINNDKEYSPVNCKWVTIQEQQDNKRRKKSKYTATIGGVTKSITDWANDYGISQQLIYERIRYQNLSGHDLVKPSRRSG